MTSYLDVILSVVLIFAVPGVTAFLVRKLLRETEERIAKNAETIGVLKTKQEELREKTLPMDYLSFKVYEKDMKQWSERCSREMDHLQKTYTDAINRIDKNIDRIFEILDGMRNHAEKKTRSTD